MNKQNSIGFNSLAWVKHEIDHSLEMARSEINAYAESPDQDYHLTRTLSLLRDVQGTLDVAELEGAAMLADESLEVVKGLADQSISNTDDACRQLIRALIQLPDYLDYVQTGQEDTPLVLVSVLNDLRAVRKVDFVSDELGEIRGLDNDDALLDQQYRSGEDLQSIAELTRLVFELGLLGWYRNSNVEESLAKMALVCRRLRLASTHRASRRLWWTAEALTEALQSERLDTSDATKTLLGRVDREIKRLFNVGEETFSATISLDLVKNLLYFIAVAKPGNTVVDEVRSAYFLDEDIPSSESLEGFQVSLSGHNKALNRSVALSLSEDLDEIKEHLEHYHRLPRQSRDDLSVLVPLFGRLGETFSALGLSAEHDRVEKIRSDLNLSLSEKDLPSLEDLEQIAGVLVEFEQSIRQFGIHRATETEGDSEGNNQSIQPSDEYFDEVRDIVIKEILEDIDQCKALIQRYASNQCPISELDGTLGHFSKVTGALHLLSLDNAGELVSEIHHYLGIKTSEKSDIDASQLDYLAEAIAAVEVYLEVLAASQIEQDSFIETGRSSLNVLRAIYDEPAETGENTEFLSATPLSEDEQSLDLTEIPELDELVVEPTLQEKVPGSTSVNTPAGTTKSERASIDTSVDQQSSSNLSVDAASETQMEDPSIVIPDVGEMPDFELPERAGLAAETTADTESPNVPTSAGIFGESLVEMPALDPSDFATLDLDALTLEGGFSDPDPDDSVELDLHELAATLTGKDAQETDFLFDESLIDSLQNQTPSEMPDMELEGIDLSISAPEQPLASVDVEETDTNPKNSDLPEIFRGLTILGEQTEEDIYEIFIEELSEEATRLNESFPSWVSDQSIEAPLIQSRRSFHTIKGSGRLVGAQIIGEFAWIHERILNQLIDHTLNSEPEVLACVQQGIELFPRLQDQLENRKLPDQPTNEHILWAEKVSQGELNSEWDSIVEKSSTAISGAKVTESIEEFDESDLDAIEMLPTMSAIATDDLDLDSVAIEHSADGDNDTDQFEPELMEIFIADANRNLQILKESASLALNSDSWQLSESAMIAVHTLNGSARTADVSEIADPFAACEKYIRLKLNSDVEFDQQDAKAVLDLVGFTHTTLNEIEEQTELSSAEEKVLVFKSLTEHLDRQIEAGIEAKSDRLTEEIIDEQIPGEGDIEASISEDPVAEDIDNELTDSEIGEIDPPENIDHAVILESLELPGSPSPMDTQGIAATQVTELVAIFVDECSELLENCDDAMVRWEQNPDDTAPVAEIQRNLHTLKGSARMAGVEEIGDLSHAMETLLADVPKERTGVNSDIFSALHGAFDQISSSASLVRQNQPIETIVPILNLLEKVRSREALSDADFKAIAGVEDEPQQVATEKEAAEIIEPVDDSPSMEELKGDLDLPGAHVEQVPEQDSRLQEAIRIRAELLDRLVDNIGEVNVFHSRVEQQVGSFDFNLKELDQTIRRVTEQLRRLEMEAEAQILHRYKDLPANPDATNANQHFDPLELDRYSKLQQLSRSLAESTSDLRNIHQLLADEVGSLDKILLQQSRVSNELQEGLMHTRMSKFKLMAPRLRRVVRRTAMDLGKEVELTIAGDDNELDRKMLESIVAPLEHLLRNAVAHGIESADKRAELGKPEVGSIEVSISREGPQIVIHVSDDGAGINEQRVLDQAKESGLISDSDDLEATEIHSLILRSGFSTADELSQVAGRGVGMDVVSAQLKQVNGVLDIQSTPGKGADFSISIPFTLAINQALLVVANKNHYAIPMGSIDGVLQLPGKSLSEKLSQESSVLTYGGSEYSIWQLSSVLEKVSPQAIDEDHVYPLLLGRSGENRVAFVVDEILGNREVVVKPVGPLLSALTGISGATILADGQIIMILDVAGMVRQTLQEPEFFEEPVDDKVEQQKLVMVVDDSITIRKVTSRMLERNNFSVVTAKDGIDAVSLLQDVHPDMLLLDIEMPRMDGFELAEHLRGTQENKDIPIIMISSRTGKKHRERAQMLGVNQFLGKPYQDHELLDNINLLLDGEKNGSGQVVH